jgi:hypothetical protein
MPVKQLRQQIQLERPNRTVFIPEHVQRSARISAMQEWCVWGRGSAKTRGLIVNRMIQTVTLMPRSLNAFVVPSFNKLQQHIIAPVRSGLADMGYHEGIHYHIGKYGDEGKGFPLPYNAPEKANQLIHFIGGGAFQFFSLAVRGSMNGASVDSIIADEVKLFEQEQFESECLPANRGNGNLFGDCHLHHGILACTDMPMKQNGNWILEKEKLMDVDQISLIEDIQFEIDVLRWKMFKGDYAPRTMIDKDEEIQRLEKDLFSLRRGFKTADGDWAPAPAIYFSTANALDNIDILGEDYLDLQMNTMTPIEFRASILNIRTEMAGQAFYPYFIANECGYNGMYDQSAQMQVSLFDEDTPALSKYDLDVQHRQPLDISFDYGASILPCVIGQEFSDKYRLLKAMHVLHPGKLEDLVNMVCDYYEHHMNKTVNYWFDHTAVGKGGINDHDYSKEVVRCFKARGWKVNEIYCGQAPGHEEKYLYFQEYFRGDTDAPPFEYNMHHCEDWETSMTLAGVRSTAKGFEKDKRNERNAKFPQQKATHYTDAFDTLIWFKYKRGMQSTSSGADWLTSR